MNHADIFNMMVEEAISEVNKSGWRTAPQNAVTLTAFGMICKKVEQKIDRIVKPAWVIAISIAGSALWFIISSILGLE